MFYLGIGHDRKQSIGLGSTLTIRSNRGTMQVEAIPMAIAGEDLQNFSRFAVAALRESHSDVLAGRIKPLDEVFADVREKLRRVE